MSKPENPPAFPRDHRHLGHNGMDLRDWFAGQALATVAGYTGEDVAHWAYNDFASHAYGIADAMIAARTKGTDA